MIVKETAVIKPMSINLALLYFGIPALVTFFVIYVVMPAFDHIGVPIFFNYLVVYATVPMLLLIYASVIAYKKEGGEWSLNAFKKRFRLNQMDRKAWLWAIGLTLFMILSAGLLNFTARWLASFDLLAPPAYWPSDLKPAAPGGAGNNVLPTEFLEVPLAGNWWVLVVVIVSLVIATLGEEIWWRGYILPRQELTHGKWTWIVHGLLWCAFHIFAPWNIISNLPGCLVLSFVA
jgi:membrane protease YdiL (CAAX protease family)